MNRNERFVAAWQGAFTAEEVVEELGLASVYSAYTRAGQLRKLGYDLKKFGWTLDVTEAEFTRVWSNSQSLDEVAERLKCRKRTAGGVASRYRKKGIPLKRFVGKKEKPKHYGVYWTPRIGRWVGYLRRWMPERKKARWIYVGVFQSREDGINACEKAKKAFGW